MKENRVIMRCYEWKEEESGNQSTEEEKEEEEELLRERPSDSNSNLSFRCFPFWLLGPVGVFVCMFFFSLLSFFLSLAPSTVYMMMYLLTISYTALSVCCSIDNPFACIITVLIFF